MSLSENFKKAHLERKSGRSRLAASALLAAVAVSASGCGKGEYEAFKNSPDGKNIKNIVNDVGPPPLQIPLHGGGSGGGGGGGGGGTY